jgi:uncharacterized protein (TIGR02246 family)
MRKMLLAGLVLGFLAGPISAFTQSSTPENELAVLRADWARTLHEKQLEASVALYTDDAAFLTPDGKRYVGKDEIRGLYKGVFSQFTGDLVFESKQTGFSGVLAYDSGLFRETLTTVATGAQQKTTGSYLMVLRREPDGKWRIVQQMWAWAPAANPETSSTRH